MVERAASSLPDGTQGFNVFAIGAPQAFHKVQCHPLAVIVICDAFARRPEGASRCIGTLLGYVSDGNVVEITDAFTVNHKDEPDGRVMMDQDYHRKMLRLKRKTTPKEQIVGWFSTGKEIIPSSIVIHTFYQTAKDSLFTPSPVLPSPLHMVVDTECAGQHMGIKVYANLATPALETLVQFHEIPLKMTADNSTSGLNLLPHAGQASGQSVSDGMQLLLQKLQKLHDYTAKVSSGAVQVGATDATLAREFSDVLAAAEPLFAADSFEQLCASTMQDTLMCVYLANLAKSQTALAEKLNTFTASLEVNEA